MILNYYQWLFYLDQLPNYKISCSRGEIDSFAQNVHFPTFVWSKSANYTQSSVPKLLYRNYQTMDEYPILASNLCADDAVFIR